MGYCLGIHGILCPSKLSEFSNILSNVDPKIARLFIISFLRATLSIGSELFIDRKIDENILWLKSNIPENVSSIHMTSMEIFRLIDEIKDVGERYGAQYIVESLRSIGINDSALQDIEYRLSRIPRKVESSNTVTDQ